MGVLRQFQQFDTLVHVGIVGQLVTLDVPCTTRLLVTPLGPHSVIKVLRHPPVELIDIHGVNSLLQPISLLLKPSDSLGMLALLVSAAVLKGPAHPLKNVVIEPELTQI